MKAFRPGNLFAAREPLSYTGSELRPHFLLEKFGLEGSGLVAFSGPCDVPTGKLVDYEDRLKGDHIRAKSMLHFLGEFFDESIEAAVLRQRLLVATVFEALVSRFAVRGLRRSGDDLFVGERKLTVSIVTSSPVSQLLHLGINLDPAGAPVPAIGLLELNVDPGALVKDLFDTVDQEWRGIEWACTKVRPVF
jgi:hypothetical protein